MVWFQCEDCGDNLKKPKLPGHFRVCSASKLSCIDCGQIFSQQAVESHTQCITEAEKYGPKGLGKPANGTNAKLKDDKKQKPDVDINVGLSDRPPWFCSLCNTKATSKQTLLLHADGKKHRAKARAHHAAKQQSKETEVTNISTSKENGSPGHGASEEARKQNPPEDTPLHENTGVQSGDSQLNKKRKLVESGKDGAHHKGGEDISAELGNGEVIQVDKAEADVKKSQPKKAKLCSTNENELSELSPKNDGRIKWKKLISSALKSTPDGVVKFKKLRKYVLKSLEEAGFTEDKSQVTTMLEHKINKSSKFCVDGKYVRLAAGK